MNSSTDAQRRGGSGPNPNDRARRRAWRRGRDRHGLSWLQRKMRSTEYCPGNKNGR